MLRRLLRHDLGQASLDYVTVLAVAGVALTAGTGVAMAKAPQLLGAVTGQMLRALCIVTAGDCDRDRAPCVVGSDKKTISGKVSVAVFELGHDQVALVEERSDGRFDVTIVDGWNPGTQFSVGVELKIPKTGLAFDGELRAAVLAHRRKGRTWTVEDADAASRLVDRLSGLDAALLPSLVDGGTDREPEVSYEESGWSTTIGAGGTIGDHGVTLALRAEDFEGARRNHRTGHRTHYLKRAQVMGAALEGTVSGKADGEAVHVWAIETDETGRPVDLMILETGEFRGTMSLPSPAAEVAGLLGVPGRHAERYEVERHLDLTVDANLRAAMAFIARVVGPFKGSDPFADRVPVSDALRDRLDRSATIHTRTYATDHSSQDEGASIAAGLKLGAQYETSTHTSRLLAALTRGPNGIWQERTDCVAR